jgi:hypothetical protein
VFSSNAGAPRINAVLTNPKVTVGVRLTRLGAGLRPGARRQAARTSRDSRVNGAS